GFGDRLGLATPGHLAAVRGSSFLPVLAQQSIREMGRTGRTPHDVLRSAADAVAATGYEGPWGTDADHLQTPADVAAVAAAGFRAFTLDPSAYVHDDAHALPPERAKPAAETAARYLGTRVELGDGVTLAFDDATVLGRIERKFGEALQHTAKLAEAVRAACGEDAFELELSIDETATPTTPLEHLFVGLELRRLDVEVHAVAPRFCGSFEKGVDYRGDLDELAAQYRSHVAIARHCGPYKLSIHSGSDKLSAYPLIGRLSGDHLHVKTAGTSYLEALRTVCRVDPALFTRIVALSRARFPTDRATYSISARPDAVPAQPDPAEAEAWYLDRDDGRQILHVTYGSVLASELAQPLRATLERHADLHAELLERHLRHHLAMLDRDFG
ncbi:MAG: hypothetical protein KDC87_02605, partial [Planctomycetes bacterium]|nr:hypothetical protein [Planctomycetota bacterium]